MSDKQLLQSILNFAVNQRASDIHFRMGSCPVLRIKGDLLNVKLPPFTSEDMEAICKTLLSSSAVPVDLKTLHEVDGSLDVNGLCRFRFNIFRFEGKLGAVLRVIPNAIPSIEQLGLSPVVKKIASMDRGFVLVTGATGQGKSTTLAAMIDYLNATRRAHIVTIEDPIEFVHHPKQCKITQREVGRDTSSFADALRSALRQDPDIILVGEMRDPESVDIALKAAETGHLVFSTVHTTDAAKTIGRLISIFPPEEQSLVRLRLADCLKATISQRLLPRADGKGRISAQEIMVVNTAISECITDPHRTAEIPIFIENSTSLLGGQTFRQHLLQLYRSGLISLDAAKQASGNAADFEHAINFDKNDSNSTWNDPSKTTEQNVSTLQFDNGKVILDKSASIRAKKPEEEGEDEQAGLIDRMLHGISRAK